MLGLMRNIVFQPALLGHHLDELAAVRPLHDVLSDRGGPVGTFEEKSPNPARSLFIA